MNRKELEKTIIERLSRSSNVIPYSAAGGKAILSAVTDTIRESLEHGDEVVIRGFGTFSVRPYAARSGINPNTGLPMYHQAGIRVHFAPGKDLKPLKEMN